MRVLAIAALSQPSHDVEVCRPVQGHCVAVEQIRDDGVVAIGGVLVGHQLAVLPDTDNIWQVEDCGVLVDGLASRNGFVGLDAANLDGLASWDSSAKS